MMSVLFIRLWSRYQLVQSVWKLFYSNRKGGMQVLPGSSPLPWQMLTKISFTRRLIQDSARTSLYLTSHCHQCQLNCEAGHSTLSWNHCFIIGSFQEWLGGKLSAHWHHDRVPAASWFQVDMSERPFIMAQTLPWLQRCFRVFWWLKTHSFPVKKQQ